MKNAQLTDNLIKHILSYKNEKSLKKFLTGILTPAELNQIPVRLEIIKRLKAGIAQHTISKDLEVGIATVTRGSRMLQQGFFKEVKKDD